MFSEYQELSDRQANCLISFLIDGTDKAIIALEEVFGLDIDSSDSDLELAPVSQSMFLQNLASQNLYAVSSEMVGEMEGRITLLLRNSDFDRLGEAMRPVLNLLFLADPDTDLEMLESEKPGWLHPGTGDESEDETFRQQMMDLLSELGNVLIGRYAKSMHQIFRLNMNHTIPLVRPGSDQKILKDIAGGLDSNSLHMVIENEFLIGSEPIKIWCLISPTHKSLSQILGITHH